MLMANRVQVSLTASPIIPHPTLSWWAPCGSMSFWLFFLWVLSLPRFSLHSWGSKSFRVKPGEAQAVFKMLSSAFWMLLWVFIALVALWSSGCSLEAGSGSQRVWDTERWMMCWNYQRNSWRGWLSAVWNPAALWRGLASLARFYRQY